MSGVAHEFRNIETRVVIKFFSLQGNAPKEIHAILIETLREHATSYAPVTNCVSQLKHKTVTIPKIIVQIHQLILEERPISAKSVAEHLGISRELFGSIIHEDLDMREIFAKWDPKSLNADQKRQRCESSEQYVNFFGAIQMISCRS
jgi:hypothetical protein